MGENGWGEGGPSGHIPLLPSSDLGISYCHGELGTPRKRSQSELGDRLGTRTATREVRVVCTPMGASLQAMWVII